MLIVVHGYDGVEAGIETIPNSPFKHKGTTNLQIAFEFTLFLAGIETMPNWSLARMAKRTVQIHLEIEQNLQKLQKFS